MKQPCVFFDRDGIVNVSPGPGYVERWEDFRLTPEFPDLLRTARTLGFLAVVITNQRGVSRGLMTAQAVETIHRNLQELLRRDYGLRLDAILYCPHAEGACTCRKPQPGLLLEAARRHAIDLEASWMIGDHERDVEAGRRASCRTVLVSDAPSETRADVVAADLGELAARFAALLRG